jgi:hypothetical protein
MDSYIVRVYRRGISKPDEEIAGLVEEVGTEKKQSFHSIAGLVITLRQLVGREESLQTVVSMLHPENTAVKAK